VVESFYGERWAQPFARVSEYLDALVPLLYGRAADVAGAQVVARGRLTIEAAGCPLLLAALGPRMLDLAGRMAAGTSVGSYGPRTIARHVAPAVSAAAERAGRPSPRIVALVGVVVTDDPAGARARAREQNAGYDAFPSYRRALDREGVARGADLLLAGTIDDIVEGLAAYARAGATDLRLGIHTGDPDERDATREALAAALAH
jgi:5,10-methylenetetrahydromethanopterin reductase